MDVRMAVSAADGPLPLELVYTPAVGFRLTGCFWLAADLDLPLCFGSQLLGSLFMFISRRRCASLPRFDALWMGEWWGRLRTGPLELMYNSAVGFRLTGCFWLAADLNMLLCFCLQLLGSLFMFISRLRYASLPRFNALWMCEWRCRLQTNHCD